uniref:Growth-regulated alpha protein-like n=4 Tax=Passeriformes TaxID=9126 RepID=A0A8C9U8E6_SERCA
MRLLPALLLLLLLSSSVPAGGLSLESLLTNMRCKCIKSTTHVINLGLILTIHVTPPGIHCRRKEVILTLKKNRQVCVTPEAPWIQLLIHKLMQRYVMPRGWINTSLTPWQDHPFPLTLLVSFLSPHKICRNGTKKSAAAAGSTVLPDPSETHHPVPPTGHIPGTHGYESLVGQE